MKTINELRQFYETTLRPDLEALELKRKQVLGRIVYLVIAIIPLVLTGILLFFKFPQFGGFFFFLPVILTVVIGGFVYKFITGDYVVLFKMLIIERLVKFIDEQLDYSYKQGISKSELNGSKIFHTKPNRYKADDLVYGKAGETAIKFSEVDAKHESGSGKNRTVVQVFKGLFFIADFNKHFIGRTVVLPDTSEKIFGKLGQAFQKWNVSRDDLIKLEDPEFEREFVVYGTDQVEARYILSTSLMQRIMEFKRKVPNKLHLSFVGSHVYIAVSYRRNLFEPKLFKTLLDFGPVEEYFNDLTLAIGIVEDLNLNTRIWTKK